MSDQRAERGTRVTPLELFFDLVVVFAITQVTTYLSRNPTWGGLLRGVLLLADFRAVRGRDAPRLGCVDAEDERQHIHAILPRRACSRLRATTYATPVAREAETSHTGASVPV